MNTKKFNRIIAGIEHYLELGVITLNPAEKSTTIQVKIADGKSKEFVSNVARNIAVFISPKVHDGKDMEDLEKEVHELSLYRPNKRLVSMLHGAKIEILS